MSNRFFAVLVFMVFLVSSYVFGGVFAADITTAVPDLKVVPVYNKYISVDSFSKSVVRVVGDSVRIRYKGGEIALSGIDEASNEKLMTTDRKAIVFGGALNMGKGGRNVIVTSLSVVNQDGTLNSMISYRPFKAQGIIQKAIDNTLEFKAGDILMKVLGIDSDINEGIILRTGKEVLVEGFYNEATNKLYVVEIMEDLDINTQISGTLTKTEGLGFSIEIIDNENKINVPVEIGVEKVALEAALQEKIDKKVTLSGKYLFKAIGNVDRNVFNISELIIPKEEPVILETVDMSVVKAVYGEGSNKEESVVSDIYGKQSEIPQIEVIVPDPASKPAEQPETPPAAVIDSQPEVPQVEVPQVEAPQVEAPQAEGLQPKEATSETNTQASETQT